jgi:P-type Cu+ transporter
MGPGAFAILLALYFGALTLVSGWAFTVQKFSDFWYYIVTLAAGFGVQVGLYVRMRELIRRSKGGGAMVAASGAAPITSRTWRRSSAPPD